MKLTTNHGFSLFVEVLSNFTPKMIARTDSSVGHSHCIKFKNCREHLHNVLSQRPMVSVNSSLHADHKCEGCTVYETPQETYVI